MKLFMLTLMLCSIVACHKKVETNKCYKNIKSDYFFRVLEKNGDFLKIETTNMGIYWDKALVLEGSITGKEVDCRFLSEAFK